MNQEDPTYEVKRDTLNHAMVVVGTAADRRDAGLVKDQRVELGACRKLIEDRSIAGKPGSVEYVAGEAEKSFVLEVVDRAMRGQGAATGLEPITWAQGEIHSRLASLIL